MGSGVQQWCVGPDVDPDKYSLKAQVGAGGEATLWRAAVMVAGEPETVAVKVLHPDHSDDVARISARWAEQAELLRFVRHPSVIGVREHFEGAAAHQVGPLIDASTSERSLYLVMNWVEGHSLRDWVLLNGGREGVVAGLRLLEQVAGALDELHSGRVTPSRRPVVHGDLSPGNVMITPEGQAVLVDFGLVRMATHRTRQAAGTPGFAAPEVWSQGTYSPASDRYGFAALGYFVLIGQAPPVEPTAVRERLFQHELLAHTPEPLARSIMNGFSTDPDQRPSPQEWLRALRGGATTSSRQIVDAPQPTRRETGARPVTHPAARRPSKPLVPSWLVLIAGLAVFIGCLVWLFTEGSTAAGTDSPPTAAERSTDPTRQQQAADSAPPTAAPQVMERRQSETPLTISREYSVDLDSAQSNWKIQSGNTGPGVDIMYFESAQGANDGLLQGAGGDVARVQGSRSFRTCEAATGYAGQVKAATGASYCVRTSERRYAYLTVRSEGEGQGVFDVVVWDPPFASG